MAGRWGGTIAQDYVERFADAYDREIQTWIDATRRGEVTGPSVWDGYAAAAVCEAGVRALEDGVRVEVELVERPEFYRRRGAIESTLPDRRPSHDAVSAAA